MFRNRSNPFHGVSPNGKPRSLLEAAMAPPKQPVLNLSGVAGFNLSLVFFNPQPLLTFFWFSQKNSADPLWFYYKSNPEKTAGMYNINAQSASLRIFLCFVRVLKVYVNCRLE